MTTEIFIADEKERAAFLETELAENRKYWMREDGTLVLRQGLDS